MQVCMAEEIIPRGSQRIFGAEAESHFNRDEGFVRPSGNDKCVSFVNVGKQKIWIDFKRGMGEGRIAAMDDAGIDAQILSHTVPSTESLEPSLARELSGQANDAKAAAISKYPDRFLGFATLPMRDPAAAARELERTVRDLARRRKIGRATHQVRQQQHHGASISCSMASSV
jgi:predicted TIM-barrel fold metal-dependent hydrolase